MSIVSAYLLPHPPIAIEQVGKGRERRISRTINSFDKVSLEISKISPETIIFLSPHSTGYSDYFHISPGDKAEGNFSNFGASKVKLTANYDQPLVESITHFAAEMGLPAGTQGEFEPALDHGMMVPMHFINKHYTDYKSVRIALSGMEPLLHYKLGKAIYAAAYKLGRKTVLVASGDLSHKLTYDGPYGYAPEAAIFDNEIMTNLRQGDFLNLMQIDPNLRERAAECGYLSAVIMAGCFDKQEVEASEYSYEGPFGVGYGVARITATKPNADRDIIFQYEKIKLERAKMLREKEDEYVNLARKSLEFIVNNGDNFKLTATDRNQMSDDLRFEKAGVFVTIYKNDYLRGCIGTTSPTQPNIAEEIILNAASAGLRDNRFPPVRKHELQFLTYKVDVLDTPEVISDTSQLDVKIYGVIVELDRKRGLLLPNLDGVDTVKQQLEIVLKKAGIKQNEPYVLKRFKVTRHEPL